MTDARAADALRAALLLMAATALDGTLRFVVAFPLVAASCLCAVRGLLRPATRTSPPVSASLWAGIAAVSALGVVAPSTGGPLWYEVWRRSFAIGGVLLVGIVSSERTAVRRYARAAAIAGAVALQVAAPHAMPTPDIDVVAWTGTALQALIHGIHPYTVQAPDVYGGARDFGFVVTVYPYMPATLLVFAPMMELLGDYRYGLAACLIVTVWLLDRVARAARVHPRLRDAAMLALVLNPVGPLVVRSGWSEPVLLVITAVFAYGLARRQRPLAIVSVLMLPTFKQYVIAPVVLCAARRPLGRNWRSWALAGAVAAATVLPFIAWNPEATLAGMVFQMRAPTHPRLTAISLPGLLASNGDLYPPIWVSGVAQLVVCGLIAIRGLAMDGAAVLLGSAVALLATFMLGWQAFINYYAFIAGLLVIAAVVAGARREVS